MLFITHVPGINNVIADHESRNFRECSEWSLCPKIAKFIFEIFGTPEIDLFANRLNNKLPRYYFFSTPKDPYSEAVDGFARSWSGLFAYAFPPFSMVGRCVIKARSDGARLILVAPVWKSQPYWPLLIKYSSGNAFTIPNSQDTLKNSYGETRPLISSDRLKLSAWLI